jgi:hypothetical protein
MAPGDEFVNVVTENSTDQELKIDVAGDVPFSVDPCSLRVDYVSVDPQQDSVTVNITSAEGFLDRRTTSKQAPARAGGPRELHIKIPESEGGVCPQPEDKFMLRVDNTDGHTVVVSFRDAELGSVRTVNTFGPLAGGWRDLDYVVVKDQNGETILWISGQIHYELGKVPEFTIYVIDE